MNPGYFSDVDILCDIYLYKLFRDELFIKLSLHVNQNVFSSLPSRGPVKYRFQTLYELDSLAVVNARDVGQCKNAFKILMFPDTRMFQAENPKSKVNLKNEFFLSDI